LTPNESKVIFLQKLPLADAEIDRECGRKHQPAIEAGLGNDAAAIKKPDLRPRGIADCADSGHAMSPPFSRSGFAAMRLVKPSALARKRLPLCRNNNNLNKGASSTQTRHGGIP
jgi:hypothetical protein